MTDQDILDFDDVGTALRERRPLHHAHAYRISVGFGGLDFKHVHVPDATPTGAHILHAAGLQGTDDISLLAILADGEFEEVLLHQVFDLHHRGAERFVAFRTDRLFKLTLNGRLIQWGKPLLDGSVLYGLAGIGEDEAVFLETAEGRRLVERGETVDLAPPGVEHFVTAPRSFEILVNARPRKVTRRKVTFEEVVQFAFPGAQPSNVVFSMTFRHVSSEPHHGPLAAGGAVEIKNGSVFNVTRTVQS